MRIVVYEWRGSSSEPVERALETLFFLAYDVVIVHNPSGALASLMGKFSAVYFISRKNMTQFCATLSGEEIVHFLTDDPPIRLWGSGEEIASKIAAFAGMRSDEVTYHDAGTIESIAQYHK
ncbi:MAG: hypothetical protein Q7R73_04890 [bacterium]|nr:hypothetical protein [bacterium]